MAQVAQAQVGGVIGSLPEDLVGHGGPIAVPASPQIVPVSNYSYSSSVFDHDGNLIVMDVIYSSSPLTPPGQPVILRFPGTTKTRVTVVTNAGTRLTSREYDGSLQVLAVGRNGVYGVLTSFAPLTTTTTGETSVTVIRGFMTTRKLVSLKIGAGGLPASLPTIDVPQNADVKISAAEVAGGLDLIAFVDASISRVLIPFGPTVSVEPRTVRLHKSDGNSFIAVTANPIPLP
jgi:hypothetical protein